MPARRTHGPLMLRATNPTKQRVSKPDLRDYNSIALRNPGARPSLDFDWDAALIRFAHSMHDLGYPLSREQQKRIDDHATT